MCIFTVFLSGGRYFPIFNLPSFTPPVRVTVGEVRYSIEIDVGGGGGGRGYDSSHFGWDQTHGKFIWHYLAISKATAGEKHPQSGSQGACGSKNDPEATPEYKKMEKNSEKTAFFTFWPLWAK